MSQIKGSISDIIYNNDENGYAVVEIITEEGATVTLTGTLPYPGNSEQLEADGEFSMHPVYGQQFKAANIRRYFPTEALAICRFLSSGVVKGVGIALARRIVDAFGDDTLNVIEHDPERLATVKGVTAKRARDICASFKSRAAIRSLNEFIVSNGLDASLAMELYKLYGDDAVAKLLENPYFLITSRLTSDFQAVDRLAIHNGYEQDSNARVAAALTYILYENQQDGHVCLPDTMLCDSASRLLSMERDEVGARLARVAADKLVIIDEAVEEPDGASYRPVYTDEMYRCECGVTQKLAMLTSRPQQAVAGIERVIRKISKEQKVEYAKGQTDALRSAASESVMILTGGPGTGKTTAVRGIISLFDELGCKTALAAPTGKAAKRMSEVCGREAKTIHRLLETGLDENGKLAFQRNIERPLDYDAIIVDELSMVDIQLFAALLDAVKNHARLVMVGDADQLPPVGPGNVLADMLGSGAIPTVRLTEIFRQAEQSCIVTGAHAVNHGLMPQTGGKEGDMFFMRRDALPDVSNTIIELVSQRLPKNMGVPPGDIQVLAPNRKGEGGIEQLNLLLQATLNPPSRDKKERKTGYATFREGDRVMQVVNNYDMQWRTNGGDETGQGVFNGDTGVISAISSSDQRVLVRFDDKIAVYPFELLDQLELSYATTVHKAQGSEYPVVILAVALRRSRLLTRSLLYTAMTRAKNMLILVGNPDTVFEMVQNNRRQLRYGGLERRLRSLCE